MNFRNMSMDELAGVMQVERNHKRFIDAAKQFVTKYLTTDLYTIDDLEKKVDEARDEGFSKGWDEGYAEAKANYKQGY